VLPHPSKPVAGGRPRHGPKHRLTPELSEPPFAGSALWDYPRPYLSLGEQRSGRALHKELLALPRHRDIPLRWVQKLGGLSSSPSDTKQFAALLVYLTGTPVSCSNCDRAARTRSAELSFEHCVALPAETSKTLNEHPEASVCCNCLIAGSRGSCSFARRRAAAGASTSSSAAKAEEDPEANNAKLRSSIHRIPNREPLVVAGPSRATFKAPERPSAVASAPVLGQPPNLNPYMVEDWEVSPGYLTTPAKRGHRGEILPSLLVGRRYPNQTNACGRSDHRFFRGLHFASGDATGRRHYSAGLDHQAWRQDGAPAERRHSPLSGIQG